MPFRELSKKTPSELSVLIRERVIRARLIQEKRFEANVSIHCNAQMSSKMLQQYCNVDDAGMVLLRTAMEKLGLSARAYDRILKVARTIADLENVEHIATDHLAEAINFRSLDRDSWGR